MSEWDYSQLIIDSERDNPSVDIYAIIAHCGECGKRIPAVSYSQQAATKILKAKYRKHARDNQETHNLPDNEMVRDAIILPP